MGMGWDNTVPWHLHMDLMLRLDYHVLPLKPANFLKALATLLKST